MLYAISTCFLLVQHRSGLVASYCPQPLAEAKPVVVKAEFIKSGTQCPSTGLGTVVVSVCIAYLHTYRRHG